MGLSALDVFFAVWIPFLWVISICCGTIFCRRRLTQPLKVRMPRLTLLAALLLLLTLSLLPLQRLPAYTGGVLALHYVVLLGSVACLLLVRLWTLVFAFGLGYERGTEAGTGWFLRHRGMASTRARVVVGVVVGVVQVLVFVALSGSLPESWHTPLPVDRGRELIDVVGSVLVLCYSLLFVICAYKLHQWGPSAFFLAQEHCLLGSLSFVSGIVYLSLSVTDQLDSAHFIACLSCGLILLVLLCFPLLKMKFGKQQMFPQFSFRRALSPKAFDDLNLDSPPDTLLAFLSKPANKKLFADFLASEFSLENLQFLDAIELYKAEYKHSNNPLSALSAAQKLWEEFFNERSPNQVSVASEMSRATTTHLNEASQRVEMRDPNVLPELICLFDDAGKMVFKHLSSDAFPRFLQSPLFTELQEEREFAPLLFAPGVRPWISWIANSTAESKEERDRLRMEAKRTSRQLSEVEFSQTS